MKGTRCFTGDESAIYEKAIVVVLVQAKWDDDCGRIDCGIRWISHPDRQPGYRFVVVCCPDIIHARRHNKPWLPPSFCAYLSTGDVEYGVMAMGCQVRGAVVPLIRCVQVSSRAESSRRRGCTEAVYWSRSRSCVQFPYQ